MNSNKYNKSHSFSRLEQIRHRGDMCDKKYMNEEESAIKIDEFLNPEMTKNVDTLQSVNFLSTSVVGDFSSNLG